jgi:hypothetical protein
MIGFAIMIVLYYLGRHPFLIPVFMDYRILLFGIFIFFTLKELRDHHQQGILYFWQGLIASFLFTSAFALITSILIFIFAALVPSFVEDYIALNLEQLKNLPAEIVERIGKEVVERNLAILPSTNAFELAKLYLWQCFVIGLFISIILSVILRRQPKTY